MMDLDLLFRSIIRQDRCAVVVCDLEHTMVYLNPAACRHYAKWGGAALVGRSLLSCHNDGSGRRIRQVVDWFAQRPDHNIVHTFYNEKEHKDVYMVALRGEDDALIGYYEKHEYRDRDTTPLYQMD
jgi:PAS domain-containing protein